MLAGSGLLCLLVNLLEGRQALEMALAEANRRLARETADRKQAQDECRAARDEAAAAHAEPDQARSVCRAAARRRLVCRRPRAPPKRWRRPDMRNWISPRGAPAGGANHRQPAGPAERRGRAEKEATRSLQTQLETAQRTIANLQARLETATRPAREVAEADAGKTQTTVEASYGPGCDRDGPLSRSLSPSEGEGAEGGRGWHGPDAKSKTMEAPQEASATKAEEEAMAVSSSDRAGQRPGASNGSRAGIGCTDRTRGNSSARHAARSETSPARKPPRAPRRKKNQRNNQMDLFEAQPAADQNQAAPAAKATAEEPAVEAPSPVPRSSPQGATAAPAPEEPEKPYGGGAGERPSPPPRPHRSRRTRDQPALRRLRPQ